MGWKQQIACSVFSSDFWESLKQEPRLIWRRLLCWRPSNLRRIRELKQQSDLQLNLGSGPHEVKGWISVDLWAPRSGVQWDVRWGIPFRTASVSRIHCEHFLEHLDYPKEANRFLAECYRVLSPGGKFRLIVPDAGKYIGAYVDQRKEFWKALHDLGGHPTSFDTEMEIMNQSFRMGGEHRFAYDKVTLLRLLKNTGFRAVEETSYLPQSELDLPEVWRRYESLYLNVAKA